MEAPLGTQTRIRALAADSRLLQPGDVGGPADALVQAALRGHVQRVIPGVYIGAEQPQHPLIEAAAWTLRHPKAVACLLTAAVYHRLTTAFERGTWIFVPAHGSFPRSRTVPVHVIRARERFIDPELDDDNGIVALQVHHVDVRITGPDRTVIDLFRYARHISPEYALEALRLRSRSRDFRIPTFARLARRLDTWNRLEPLIQGLALR